MYEWDEAKREKNLNKHHLDFLSGHLVYESPAKVTFRLPHPSEERFLDLAFVTAHEAVLGLVYTVRKGNVRFISFRRASREERRVYASARAGQE